MVHIESGRQADAPWPSGPGEADLASLRLAYEEAREDQLHLHQAILDNIPNPIFYKDVQGRFLNCNLAFETNSSMTRAELLGKTAFDLLPREEAGQIDRQEKALLERDGMEVYPLTVTIPPRARRQLLIHQGTFRRRNGELGGIVGSIIEITEQTEAEEALRRKEELLTTISDNMMDLMSIVDDTGRRLYSSRSYLSVLGYLPEELDALEPLALLHPDDRARVRGALGALFRGGEEPRGLCYRMRHRDGHWLHFESRGTLVAGTSGTSARALLIARDITAREAAEEERKQLEVQLRHAQKLEAIGSLAAGIAHEINTPTQYIGDNLGFLQEALGRVMAFLTDQRRFLEVHQDLDGLRSDAAEALNRFQELDLDYLTAEIPKAIQQTVEGLTRVATIVSAMKDFSHPGEDVRTPVDLNRSIENTLMVARNEYKYVADLEVDLDPTLEPVPCFQGEFNQALLNLVVNAAHAIDEAHGARSGAPKGLIRVGTRQVGNEVVVTVADNGMGIPESLRERIFEPFFTTKPVGKGTGQGLAIVHAVVVQKHGGRIRVDSERGQGTTFQLWLPLRPPFPAGRNQP